MRETGCGERHLVFDRGSVRNSSWISSAQVHSNECLSKCDRRRVTAAIG